MIRRKRSKLDPITRKILVWKHKAAVAAKRQDYARMRQAQLLVRIYQYEKDLNDANL